MKSTFHNSNFKMKLSFDQLAAVAKTAQLTNHRKGEYIYLLMRLWLGSYGSNVDSSQSKCDVLPVTPLPNIMVGPPGFEPGNSEETRFTVWRF